MLIFGVYNNESLKQVIEYRGWNRWRSLDEVKS